MYRIYLVLLTLCFTTKAFAQGCSDAGVCSVGSLRTDATRLNFKKWQPDTLKHQLVITPAISLGEQNTLNFTPSFDATFSLHKYFSINVRNSFNITKGNLGVAYGAGDVLAGGIFHFINTDSVHLSLLLGAKLNIQRANFSINNRVLPLSYQSSIGTNDVLAAASFNYKTWYVGLGFQHSLNRSNNTFLHSRYDSSSAAQGYFESNRLQRAPDVVLRFEKKFLFRKINLGLGAGFIFIYHLLQDSQIDGTGTRVKIKGSEGTTLNLTGNINYQISPRWGLNLGFGFPVITRQVRPDGLTRSLVVLPSVQYGF